MTQKALCPYCSHAITRLNIHVVEGFAGPQIHRCVVYACAQCNKAINAVTDPISIREDLFKVIREEKYADTLKKMIKHQS